MIVRSIPVFNEEKTILEIFKRVNDVKIHGIDKEIVVVNDGSTDTTASVISNFILSRAEGQTSNLKVVRHDKNQGKGAAVRSGIKYSTGDYILIQDADLEYDPNDYSAMKN
jgi:glycosyltransferase involved in cell wall biosynthesis